MGPSRRASAKTQSASYRPRVSLLGSSRSRSGSAASLAGISGAFRPHSRSRHTSSGSGTGTGTGGGSSSRHDSHVSSSVSLAPSGHRARAHSLMQKIAGASRSSVELVLGRMSSTSQQHQPMRIGGDSASDGGALSNPENHTFGMPVVGGAGSSLPRHAGVRARTLETSTRRSPVSFVSGSNGVTAAAAARTRSTSSSASSSAASQRALALARERAGIADCEVFRLGAGLAAVDIDALGAV
jgi:hypothetical protein